MSEAASVTMGYLTFIPAPQDPKRKTKVWAVVGDDGSTLGLVSWYAPWRRYAFSAARGRGTIVLEHDCLRTLASFCESQTEKRKRVWKRRTRERPDRQQPSRRP